VFEGRVAIAKFDFGQIRPLNVGMFSEFLLRPTFPITELPDTISECDGSIVARLRHQEIVGCLTGRDNTLIVTIGVESDTT
jgi:hypothetical protein